jgi:cell wall-associated NlpC family hydrolase
MIEQSRRPLMPPSGGDLTALEQRANRQRSQHRRSPRSFAAQWLQVRTALGSPIHSVLRLPARFLLHAVVALVLPLAVLLSQLPMSAPMPAAQPMAPRGDGDLIAPIAPLELNDQTVEGDAPLEDNGDIPVPLSLVSRSEALAPVAIMSAIVGDRVYLRNGPGTDYDAVGRMSGGAPVQVIGRSQDGSWFQIRERAGKPTYWISGELLDLPDDAINSLFEIAPDQIPPPPPPKVATVRESGLSMRDGPGTNYISMDTFQAGAKIDLIERYQDWFHIGIPGGADGWVKGEFLSIDPGITDRLLIAEAIPDPNPALIGSIAENAVNLRKGPDPKYTKIGGVNAGAQLALIGKYKDWFQVKLSDGTKAWIFQDLLNVTGRVARRLPVSKDFPKLPITARASGGRLTASPGLANIRASGDVASYAVQFAGSRYVYGGSGPRGFDCSGFTSYVYGNFGVGLPHSAAAQYSTAYGAAVGDMGNLAPGDLVFFRGTGGHRGISHVALYIGGGRVIHAMTPRYGVQVSNINDSYWVQHYYGAIRPRR